MRIIKIITTIGIVFLMAIIFWFMQPSIKNKEKVCITGFGFMEVIYLLSLILIWS